MDGRERRRHLRDASVENLRRRPGPGRAACSTKTGARYGAQDIRFTAKSGVLYAFFLGWPEDGKLAIASLGTGTVDKPALLEQKITLLHLLGSKEKIAWSRDSDGLRVTLPATKPCDEVFGLKLALG